MPARLPGSPPRVGNDLGRSRPVEFGVGSGWDLPLIAAVGLSGIILLFLFVTSTIRILVKTSSVATMSCHRSKNPGTPTFNASSTALEVANHANFTGKHAVVTGGNSGLGLETVRGLYAAGADGTLT